MCGKSTHTFIQIHTNPENCNQKSYSKTWKALILARTTRKIANKFQNILGRGVCVCVYVYELVWCECVKGNGEKEENPRWTQGNRKAATEAACSHYSQNSVHFIYFCITVSDSFFFFFFSFDHVVFASSTEIYESLLLPHIYL